MARISELSDDLLIKILSFLPTKIAVSTSIFSKQWRFLWLWLPKLEYDDFNITTGPLSSFLSYRDFIDKNLPLHRAPAMESLLFRCHVLGLLQADDINRWVEIAVSRLLRELSISYFRFVEKPSDVLSLPSSLYTCDSLVTLKLRGKNVAVDVPQTVCLPSLKNLQLQCVTYSNGGSLGLLLSHCPVLEDLLVERDDDSDNRRAVIVNVPSLQRLSLRIGRECSSDGYVLITPSVKYFKFEDYRGVYSIFLVEPMPKLEEADIYVMQGFNKFLESIISVKRLSLRVIRNSPITSSGIVFSQLEHLKLCICSDNWSKLLVWLLRKSPKLRVLNLYVDQRYRHYMEYEPVDWENEHISVPECLLRSLETFEFKDYMGTQEEIYFLSFFFKHASCLTSTSVIDRETQLGPSPSPGSKTVLLSTKLCLKVTWMETKLCDSNTFSGTL
ncbi:unnamed protein product [Microthlaspi erraticum]|uniref:FBD domain-containing protein n=1 Tax=Microthlaspi erraticum TaxID=1685480 RepID=A0A6D2K468_9BRAS|nr:unnamed protein product [Microthlaspi erraticum]